MNDQDGADALGLAEVELTERVADAMRAASKAYLQAIVDGLAVHGMPGLTPATMSLLAQLGPEGATTSALARQKGRTKQATGKLVADLEAKGYVTRRPDPGDRRGQIIMLTDAGVSALDKGADMKSELTRIATDALGSGALKQLHVDLGKLTKALVSVKPS